MPGIKLSDFNNFPNSCRSKLNPHNPKKSGSGVGIAFPRTARTLLAVGALVVTLMFSGCLKEDGYSLDNFSLSFGMVKKNVNNNFYFVTDEGRTLDPVVFGEYTGYNYGYESSFAKWKEGDRVLTNFTILDEKKNTDGKVERYYVKINSLQKILLKDIIEINKSNSDSIGNNPIQVLNAWVTDSIVNFKVRFIGKYKTHYLNLVNQPVIKTDPANPVELELRHNTNDDVEAYPFISFVSFRLNKLKSAGPDSVRFIIKAKNYDNTTYQFTGKYKY